MRVAFFLLMRDFNKM